MQHGGGSARGNRNICPIPLVRCRLMRFCCIYNSSSGSLFVDTSLWLPSWLQFLLSVELPLPALLRLWDFYFSDDECVQMHMFVCLGMLQVGVQAALAVGVLLRAERVAAAPSRCVAGCAIEAAGLERPQRRVLSSHVSACCCCCCCCCCCFCFPSNSLRLQKLTWTCCCRLPSA